MSTYNERISLSISATQARTSTKQEELPKAKLQNEVKKAQLKKPLEIKNKDVEQRKEKDGNDEYVDIFEKSKSALESGTEPDEKLLEQSKRKAIEKKIENFLSKLGERNDNVTYFKWHTNNEAAKHPDAAKAEAARNRKRARMGFPLEEDELGIVQQVVEEVKDEEKWKQNGFEEKKEPEREAARKLEEKGNNDSESSKIICFSSKKQKKKHGTNNLNKKDNDIAPPPTFDYYGPIGVKKSKPSNVECRKFNCCWFELLEETRRKERHNF